LVHVLYSSEDDSDYDDLMAEIPVAVGRQAPAAAPKLNPFKPAPLPPRPVLPPKSGAAPVEQPLIPEMTDPMEGLAFFQNIRKDLEKVGRMITAKKDGEKFIQRAHLLASINCLAANVPACVLDHLGQEIRRSIDKKESDKKEEVDTIDIADDDASEVSDLGDDDIAEKIQKKEAITAAPQRRKTKRTFSFLPGEEVENKLPGDMLPYISNFCGTLMFGKSIVFLRFSCVCLFSRFSKSFSFHLAAVDISGFTMLSTMMDPENLSKVISKCNDEKFRQK